MEQLLPVLDRPCVLLSIESVHNTHIVQSTLVNRLNREDPLVQRNRLIEHPEVAIASPHIRDHIGDMGIELQCLFIIPDRFPPLTDVV